MSNVDFIWISHEHPDHFSIKFFNEYYDLIYEYKNDCLTAAIKYNKDYYSDTDLKPNEEIFFSISIIPLSTFNSPNKRK